MFPVLATPPLPPTCTYGQTSVRLAAVSGGLDHAAVAVVFTDMGRTCSLDGYPAVKALAASGKPELTATRSRSGYLGGLSGTTPIQPVTLTRGQSASAMVEWLSGPIQGAACKTVKYLSTTAPGGKTPVADPLGARATSICKLEVHPVVKGTTGDGR